MLIGANDETHLCYDFLASRKETELAMRIIVLKYDSPEGGRKVIHETGVETISWLIRHIRLSNVTNISFAEIEDGKVLWEKQFVEGDVVNF